MTIQEYKKKIISIIQEMESEYGSDLKDCRIWTEKDSPMPHYETKDYHITFEF